MKGLLKVILRTFKKMSAVSIIGILIFFLIFLNCHTSYALLIMGIIFVLSYDKSRPEETRDQGLITVFYEDVSSTNELQRKIRNDKTQVNYPRSFHKDDSQDNPAEDSQDEKGTENCEAPCNHDPNDNDLTDSDAYPDDYPPEQNPLYNDSEYQSPEYQQVECFAPDIPDFENPQSEEEFYSGE